MQGHIGSQLYTHQVLHARLPLVLYILLSAQLGWATGKDVDQHSRLRGSTLSCKSFQQLFQQYRFCRGATLHGQQAKGSGPEHVQKPCPQAGGTPIQVTMNAVMCCSAGCRRKSPGLHHSHQLRTPAVAAGIHAVQRQQGTTVSTLELWVDAQAFNQE
jgi:hypothetical protein